MSRAGDTSAGRRQDDSAGAVALAESVIGHKLTPAQRRILTAVLLAVAGHGGVTWWTSSDRLDRIDGRLTAVETGQTAILNALVGKVHVAPPNDPTPTRGR